MHPLKMLQVTKRELKKIKSNVAEKDQDTVIEIWNERKRILRMLDDNRNKDAFFELLEEILKEKRWEKI